MIENLETLVTLSKTGTMMETSTVLKISQSAVSKRIAALERYYDRALIERHGRRVALTYHGTRLVEKVTPLISELRSVFLEDNALQKGKIIIGVSEAILASWGPRVFAEVQQRVARSGVHLSRTAFADRARPHPLRRIHGRHLHGFGGFGNGPAERGTASGADGDRAVGAVADRLPRRRRVVGDHHRVALRCVAVDRRRHAPIAAASFDVA